MGRLGSRAFFPFSLSEFLGVPVVGGILTSCAVELVCMRALMDLLQFQEKTSWRQRGRGMGEGAPHPEMENRLRTFVASQVLLM
jgi:hypothetical protein